MTRAAEPNTGQDSLGPQDRAVPLGSALASAFRALLEAIPGGPQSPTSLGRQLGLSRVTISKLVNAIASPDPYHVLQRVPGPESLRVLTHAAAQLPIAPELIAEAQRVTEAFAKYIRQEFGTRGALNAAISPNRPETQLRFEQSSRYQVYKGLREILGVDADTWLNCMLFMPSEQDPDFVKVTSIHGAIAMRRLRPDVQVYFTTGSPAPVPGIAPVFAPGSIALEDLYTHTPARLESSVAGGLMVHRLADDRLGRSAVADMLTVTQNQRGSRRYASPERPRGGAVLFPDIPVKTVVFDVMIHDDIFPGAEPELIVFNTGVRGPANPNDPSRVIDRIAVPEKIETLGKAGSRFDVEDVPNYAAIVHRVAAALQVDLGTMRLFRLRMAYPVHGFQFVMAFDAPTKTA